MEYDDYTDPEFYKDILIEPPAPSVTTSPRSVYEHPIHRRRRILRTIGNNTLRAMLYLAGVASSITGITIFLLFRLAGIPAIFFPLPVLFLSQLLPQFITITVLVLIGVSIVAFVLTLIFYRRPRFTWKQRLIYAVILTILVGSVSEAVQRTLFQHLMMVMEQTGNLPMNDMGLLVNAITLASLMYGGIMMFIALR